MISIRYLFSKSQEKIAFLSVSAPDLIFAKNPDTFYQKLSKLWWFSSQFLFFNFAEIRGANYWHGYYSKKLYMYTGKNFGPVEPGADRGFF